MVGKVKDLNKGTLNEKIINLGLLSILEEEDYSSPNFEEDLKFMKIKGDLLKKAVINYLDELKPLEERKCDGVSILPLQLYKNIEITSVRELVAFYNKVSRFNADKYHYNSCLRAYMSILRNLKKIQKESVRTNLMRLIKTLMFDENEVDVEDVNIFELFHSIQGVPFSIKVRDVLSYEIGSLLNRYEYGLINDFAIDIRDDYYESYYDFIDTEEDLKDSISRLIRDDFLSIIIVRIKINDNYFRLSKINLTFMNSFIDILKEILKYYIESFISVAYDVEIDKERNELVFISLKNSHDEEMYKYENPIEYSLNYLYGINHIFEKLEEISNLLNIFDIGK